MCFYGDTLSAIAMWAVVYYFEKKNWASEGALTPLRKNIMSIFGHGCGHLYVGLNLSDTGAPEEIAHKPLSEKVMPFVGFMFFWYAFMQAILKDQYPKSVSIALSVLWNLIQLNFIPAQFGFTYVQTVLFFVSALSGMARTDKDMYYDLSTIIVSIPVGLAGWLEAVTCDYFLV